MPTLYLPYLTYALTLPYAYALYLCRVLLCGHSRACAQASAEQPPDTTATPCWAGVRLQTRSLLPHRWAAAMRSPRSDSG